jgi:hydroxypyruvate isomerase
VKNQLNKEFILEKINKMDKPLTKLTKGGRRLKLIKLEGRKRILKQYQ